MGDETPAETPWAVAKRMRAEGHPRNVIVEPLKAMGLDDGDVRVLLFTPLSLLWIAMAAVMVISSLLARSEIKAARKACVTP